MKHGYLRFTMISLLLFGAAALPGCSGQEGQAGGQPETGPDSTPEARSRALSRVQATANIEPKGDSALTGTAVFTQSTAGVALRLKVENGPPGGHAIHLHEFGDCSSADGKSAGGHWNPQGVDHGKWGTEPFHLGDIGNMQIDQFGQGTYTIMTDRWTIGGPEDTNIVGRAIIIHSGLDDFTSQPTGNAGGRIGCGVIEIQELSPQKR